MVGFKNDWSEPRFSRNWRVISLVPEPTVGELKGKVQELEKRIERLEGLISLLSIKTQTSFDYIPPRILE